MVDADAATEIADLAKLEVSLDGIEKVRDTIWAWVVNGRLRAGRGVAG